MKPGNSKTKQLIIFCLLLLATAGLASLLVAAVWHREDAEVVKPSTPQQAVTGNAGYISLFACNTVLVKRVTELQQLDQQYATLLTEPNSKKMLDAVNQQIFVQEEIFRGSLDSAFLNTTIHGDSGINKLFTSILAGYRSILQNRGTVGSLRTTINMNKTGLSPNQAAVLKNQNELRDKNNKIALLETTIKEMATKTKIADEPIAKEKDDVIALRRNIADQNNKVAALVTINSTLKQDNDKLLKLESDYVKNISAGDAANKNKTTSLQQKVDALNAELRLAQVDCNLSRVDAGQIISTSKQRKQLLSEASGILTNMANSEDVIIKKKVQDKITRLNQIAANSRD